ncbi:MAG: glycosyltransferase, partial [Lachnospiraceae bacterium]
PSYPYTGEQQKRLLHYLLFRWDELYTGKLQRIVDRIVTYSQYDEIWGIPTIRTMNGIEINEIKTVSPKKQDEEVINLIFVALMQPYHGCERLLYGLKEYYKLGGDRRIICHFVGDGIEKRNYEKIVEENGLQKNVYFYGRKGGAELDEIYDKADIGIGSLGGYKKQYFWASELKSKEYMARGIPFITGTKSDLTDILDSGLYLEFPNDSSIIDINRIIAFYDETCKNKRAILIEKLRQLAEEYVSMEATMRPINEYIS